MDSLTAADIPAGLLGRARHVHVSSYFLLADSLGPGLADLFAEARAAGATTSLDTNWDPAERWRDERLSAAIAQAGLLLPNEAEALALSGAPPPRRRRWRWRPPGRGWPSSWARAVSSSRPAPACTGSACRR